ncbi:MAG TPA: transcriptional regulator [Opitutales bacterium]|nr:transcriptional regulator [Opitutales bacterium]
MSSVENPFSTLSRVMHEPNRLALMSVLAAAVDGLSFSELKDACDLTDGNLNRHLKALEDDGIVSQRKETVKGGRPRTTVTLTPAGRRRFVKYLENLEGVLQQAAAALRTPPAPSPLFAPRLTRA